MAVSGCREVLLKAEAWVRVKVSVKGFCKLRRLLDGQVNGLIMVCRMWFDDQWLDTLYSVEGRACGLDWWLEPSDAPDTCLRAQVGSVYRCIEYVGLS